MARDIINTAIIGCGSFVRHFHIPNMAQDDRYRIYAACDINEEAARSVCREYRAEYATTDVERVLADPEVALVVIGTRHNLHASLTTMAAEAGKHVLCEKPMGITYDECRRVMKAVSENGIVYTIGYNRGMAPLISKARKILARQNEPVAMYHRIQTYLGAKFHWLLGMAEGGGRIIGEGCHILDLFCVVADSDPVRVYAEGGIFTKHPEADTPDTATITVGFENGSIANVLIPSIGNSLIPKESTEIYSGNVAIVIEDFQRMTACVGEQKEEVSLDTVDKGHRIEIDLLAEAVLHGGPVPNDVSSAARAAVLCLKAIEAMETHQVQPVSREEYVI